MKRMTKMMLSGMRYHGTGNGQLDPMLFPWHQYNTYSLRFARDWFIVLAKREKYKK